MKTCFNFSILAVILFFLQSCSEQGKVSYEQSLGVISNIRMHQQIVEDNPNKKMVDLEKFIPGISLDIRYATTNNFTKQKIYKKAKAFVRLPIANALKDVQEELKSSGLGLLIFDAYRPYDATVKFYEVYPDTNFVAAPWHGSRHNRGCAVDVSLIDLESGAVLEMPTPFDDFSEKAGHAYMDLSANALKNRQLLRNVMIKHGFTIYPQEWWHYDFAGWEEFELLNISFKDLED